MSYVAKQCVMMSWLVRERSEQDPRIEYTRDIVKKMREGGVNVRFNSYPGDHEWQVWRKSLHESAQYLFK